MLCLVSHLIAIHLVSVMAQSAQLNFFSNIQFTAQFVAFHGDQINYNTNNTVGQRWAGHLGVRFSQIPDEIFGFNPSSNENITREQRTEFLLNGLSYPGKVSKDANLFYEALQSPHGFTVVFYDVPNDACNTADCGYGKIQNDLLTSPLTNTFYAYPPTAPRAYKNINFSACDNLWGETCFNCATYTHSLGIAEVETSGLFMHYIPALAAQPTAHCKCIINGLWVRSVLCTRDFLSMCAYKNPTDGDRHTYQYETLALTDVMGSAQLGFDP